MPRPTPGTPPWLHRAPSPTAAGRVFCIPHAGCGTGIFNPWPPDKDGVEFLYVELPGRLSRFGEKMPDTFQELAAAMIAGLRPYLDVPYAIFGHCWSALLAYEATAQLERSALPQPARLYVSSQLAPQDGPSGRMLGMDDAQLAEELAVTIREQGNQPHPELVAMYVKVLRGDVEMSRRYVVPDPARLSTPISAIGWDEDEEVAASVMGGWTACGEVDFELFAGRHHQFMTAPAQLLDCLSSGVK
jgi:surfactin synthase thioesterase subunit